MQKHCYQREPWAQLWTKTFTIYNYIKTHQYPFNHSFSALQLAEYPYGDGIEVIFAGGRSKFISKNQTDPEYPNKRGERLDGRNLIQEWVDKHPNSQYVWNKTGFDQIDVEKIDHVIGNYALSFIYLASMDWDLEQMTSDKVGLNLM